MILVPNGIIPPAIASTLMRTRRKMPTRSIRSTLRVKAVIIAITATGIRSIPAKMYSWETMYRSWMAASVPTVWKRLKGTTHGEALQLRIE